MVVVHRFFLHLGPGGRCSEVVLVLILLGRDLGWWLLTGGRYSEVVVNTGLTVLSILAFPNLTALFKQNN